MNRHPIDRMADIKSEMAALKLEHDELSRRVIDDEIKPMGNEWRAAITKRQVRKFISFDEAERILGTKAFESVIYATEQTWVSLKRMDDDPL